MARQYPKWVSPSRQAQLVNLFLESGGFCVYGHTPCQGKWDVRFRAICLWGRTCQTPKPNQLCRFKPDEPNKPQLPCRYYLKRVARWHCAYGDYPCYAPYQSHYESVETSLIREWIGDDKAQRQAKSQAEQRLLHRLPERGRVKGEFNAISRDIFFGNQPEWYIEGIGVSGLTYLAFVKVKLASSFVALYVELPKGIFGQVSKAKRRKAIRYGKPLAKSIQERIDQACSKAVRHYLK